MGFTNGKYEYEISFFFFCKYDLFIKWQDINIKMIFLYDKFIVFYINLGEEGIEKLEFWFVIKFKSLLDKSMLKFKYCGLEVFEFILNCRWIILYRFKFIEFI